MRRIVDGPDDAAPDDATARIVEANRLVQDQVSMSAMSRAHREILHLARLLARLAADLPTEKVDRYLVRDTQRMIEAIETLVRMHSAQGDDIYEAVVAEAA